MTVADSACTVAAEAACCCCCLAPGLKKLVSDDCFFLAADKGVVTIPGTEKFACGDFLVPGTARFGEEEEEGGGDGDAELLLGRLNRDEVMPRFPGAAWPKRGASKSL